MKIQIATLLGSALVLSAASAIPNTAPGYVVHEWGTFTSVQGSDGELIPWNPFVESDLPDFVYTRKRPFKMTNAQAQAYAVTQMLTKSSQSWLQRMETPVIYLHATEDFTVNVSVEFPSGVMTEWYPAASSFGPVVGLAPLLANSNRSHLDWERLRVLGGTGKDATIPTSADPSHYFTARTDAASPVRVQRAPDRSQLGEEEKFLFYRGAGNFTTPLHVFLNSAGEIVLENRGRDDLGTLFVFQAHDNSPGFAEISGIKTGENLTVSLATLESRASAQSTRTLLAERLEATLTETGLFPEEAAAMVNTWRGAWLGDRGLRVLYLLPQAWTDATIPLTLDPAPRNTVRVMLGRAEILEPEVERPFAVALHELLQNGTIADPTPLKSLVEKRFLEPAISRAALTEINRRQPRVFNVALPGENENRERERVTAINQAAARLRQSLDKPEEPKKSMASANALTVPRPSIDLFDCGPATN